MNHDKIMLTYSALSTFRNCRKKAQYKYVDGLVPIETDRRLSFGSLIHRCLEMWYDGPPSSEIRLSDIIGHIDRYYQDAHHDDRSHSDWHMARAIVAEYIRRYGNSDDHQYHVISVERKFHYPIINPRTKAESRTFQMRGIVDGIVRDVASNKIYLMEHKTASSISGGYIERLWTDTQIILYTHYIEMTMGVTVAGIIYNVLGKTSMKQKMGESEGDYEIRRAELAAKSKTGKSSARRQMPESDEEYAERLAAKYLDQSMMHREEIVIDRDRISELNAEIWELTQSWLLCRRSDIWYKNTDYCFKWNSPCEYYPLCSSGNNLAVRENFYQKLDNVHGEFKEEKQSDNSDAQNNPFDLQF